MGTCFARPSKSSNEIALRLASTVSKIDEAFKIILPQESNWKQELGSKLNEIITELDHIVTESKFGQHNFLNGYTTYSMEYMLMLLAALYHENLLYLKDHIEDPNSQAMQDFTIIAKPTKFRVCGLLQELSKSQEKVNTDRIPIMCGLIISIFRSKDEKECDDYVDLLMDYEGYSKIDPDLNKNLGGAISFIGKLIMNEDISRHLTIFEAFNLSDSDLQDFKTPSDKMSKELKEELVEFINAPIYSQKDFKTRKVCAVTYPGGSITICKEFLVKEHSDLNTARLIIILLHELAHKKRKLTQAFGFPFKRTPEKYGDVKAFKEAGLCFEQNVLGGVVDPYKINEEIASEICQLDNWKSKESIRKMFEHIVSDPLENNGTTGSTTKTSAIESGVKPPSTPPLRLCGTHLFYPSDEMMNKPLFRSIFAKTK